MDTITVTITTDNPHAYGLIVDRLEARPPDQDRHGQLYPTTVEVTRVSGTTGAVLASWISEYDPEAGGVSTDDEATCEHCGRWIALDGDTWRDNSGAPGCGANRGGHSPHRNDAGTPVLVDWRKVRTCEHCGREVVADPLCGWVAEGPGGDHCAANPYGRNHETGDDDEWTDDGADDRDTEWRMVATEDATGGE